MLTRKQKEEIIKLISIKQEGAYWDFKKEWYEEGRLDDLLHDVICMANNMENRDAYIIIGIDEENDYSVNDLTYKENRKSTQMLVDFLRDKKFVGGVRPQVTVESMQILEGTIDIIVIINGFYTPYVLEERYRGVNANNIYTRIFDTNTPKNKTADISHVEYLWKKRFRLLTSPLEQVFYYLQRKDEWLDVNDDSSMIGKYYKYHPEYIIEHCYCDDRDGYEYYLFSQTDSRPHWWNIYVRYHQTTLFSTLGVSLDGGRYFTNIPQKDFLFDGFVEKNTVVFCYYIKGTEEMVLHEFFYEDDNSEERYAKYKFEECVLIFDSEEEKSNFKNYAKSKWPKRKKYLDFVKIPHIESINNYRIDVFKENYENAIILNNMLKEYRSLVYDKN